MANGDNTSEPMFEDISDGEKDTEADGMLKAYKEALEQEWKDKTSGASARAIAGEVKERIIELVPEALTGMRMLALGAVSENVRLQANKWLLDNALLPGKAASTDTMTELLEEMNSMEKEKDAERTET